MCGIAGVIAARPGPEWLTGLGRASQALRHRGPDDEGVLCFPAPDGRATLADRAEELRPPDGAGPWLALANRRLAIIDPTAAGHQPMASADGRYFLVYNGEIYNYLELRRELEGLGRRFRSHSDTEVLLEGFAEWGPAILPRLLGMFAFAVLDTRERRLFLARDPFGIKPLFYHRHPGGLVFASEIRALLEFPGVGRQVEPQRLHDYLLSLGTDHGDGTLFAGVRQLASGHYFQIALDSPDGTEPTAYWRLDLDRRTELSFEQAAERLRDLFLESVRLHLRSDVPLGFALSGGTDSSAIVMAARQLQGKGAELHTFSFVADDPAINEERYSDAVNRAAGTVAHKLQMDPTELAQGFDRLTEAQGEPFASPSISAQHRICAIAADVGLKVLLTGQGSDELLAGYQFYLPARVASAIRRGHWVRASQLIQHARALPGMDSRQLLRATARLLAPPLLRRSIRRLRSAHRPPSWLDAAWFEDRDVRPTPPWDGRGRDLMRQQLHHTLVHSHVPALLRYEDRNTMAFSLEGRVPFLTTGLAEFVFSLPDEYIVGADGTSKAVFRAAMRGIVPDLVLDRRDKIGFASPIVDWLAALGPWVETKLKDARAIPGLNSAEIQRSWAAVRATRSLPAAYVIWRLVSLVTWAERYDVRFT